MMGAPATIAASLARHLMRRSSSRSESSIADILYLLAALGQRAADRDGIGQQEEALLAVKQRRESLFHQCDIVAHGRNVTAIEETEFEHGIERRRSLRAGQCTVDDGTTDGVQHGIGLCFQ